MYLSMQAVLNCSHHNVNIQVKETSKSGEVLQSDSNDIKESPKNVIITLGTTFSRSSSSSETEWYSAESASSAEASAHASSEKILGFLTDYLANYDDCDQQTSNGDDVVNLISEDGSTNAKLSRNGNILHTRQLGSDITSKMRVLHTSIINTSAIHAIKNTTYVGSSAYHASSRARLLNQRPEPSKESAVKEDLKSGKSFERWSKLFKDICVNLHLREPDVKPPSAKKLSKRVELDDDVSDDKKDDGEAEEATGIPKKVDTDLKKRVRKMNKVLLRFTMNQKLYFDLDRPGDFDRSLDHSYHKFRYMHTRRLGDSYYSEISKGDGVVIVAKGSLSIDYMIYRESTGPGSWKREYFRPAILFPNLYHMGKEGEGTTLLRDFTPLLKLIDVKKKWFINMDWSLYDEDGKITMADVMCWKPAASTSNSATEIKTFLQESFCELFAPQWAGLSDERLDVEHMIDKAVTGFAECVVQGYIDAFNILDNFESLGKHNTDEIYLKAFKFYTRQPYMDLGFMLIMYLGISPRDLDHKAYPTGSPSSINWKQGFRNSIELLEEYRKRGNSKLTDNRFTALQATVAFFNSPYFTCYVLRRLLFWVDNVKTDIIKYKQEQKRHASERKLADSISHKIVFENCLNNERNQ
jgi:hypothetical protein